MTLTSTTRPYARAGAASLCLALAFACGGGDDAIPTRTTATFVADVESPGPGTVTLQPGTSDGTLFQVRVVVTGAEDFFGATLRIRHNLTPKPDGSENYHFTDFYSWNTSGSFLRDTEGLCQVAFFEDHSDPDVVAITATRLYDAEDCSTGVDVDGSADLLMITFRARSDPDRTSDPISDRLEFGEDPAPVAYESTQPSPGVPLALTWEGGGSVTVN